MRGQVRPLQPENGAVRALAAAEERADSLKTPARPPSRALRATSHWISRRKRGYAKYPTAFSGGFLNRPG